MTGAAIAEVEHQVGDLAGPVVAAVAAAEVEHQVAGAAPVIAAAGELEHRSVAGGYGAGDRRARGPSPIWATSATARRRSPSLRSWPTRSCRPVMARGDQVVDQVAARAPAGRAGRSGRRARPQAAAAITGLAVLVQLLDPAPPVVMVDQVARACWCATAAGGTRRGRHRGRQAQRARSAPQPVADRCGDRIRELTLEDAGRAI